MTPELLREAAWLFETEAAELSLSRRSVDLDEADRLSAIADDLLSRADELLAPSSAACSSSSASYRSPWSGS